MMKLVSVVLLLLAPALTSCEPLILPLDCSDIYNHDNSQTSGVYTIYPIGATSPVQVYCDMDSDGGQWTVFQRRMDGSVNFYRAWDQYKKGFGFATGEYWLGLENLYHLTLRKKYELLVDMENFHERKGFARYSSFSIESESNGYKLHVSGYDVGGAGDALSYHNGEKFSTFDKEHNGDCAKRHLGGFWYSYCYYANPNGIYRHGAEDTVLFVGVEWYPWMGPNYSLKTISMKIRPVQ